MKYLIPPYKILAIGLALIIVKIEFTSSKAINVARFTNIWYEYIGPDSYSGRSNNMNYVRFVPQPSNIQIYCPGRQVLCAVRLPDNGMYPQTLTGMDIVEIETAITLQSESNNVQLRFESE